MANKHKRIFDPAQLRLRLAEPYYNMVGDGRSWSLVGDERENKDFYLSYREFSHSDTTTLTKKCSIPDQVGQDILDKAVQLKASPFEAKPIRGSDGRSQEIEFFAGFHSCKFHWWCDYVPDGWTELADFYHDTPQRFIDILNRAPDLELKVIEFDVPSFLADIKKQTDRN